MLAFLGIGAQKAGTTWLFERLAIHPEIRFPGGKELHYWDDADRPPPQTWLDHFDASTSDREGEITPAYALLDVPTIRALHRIRPDLRLFFALRSPAQRAWSSALMALSRAELAEPEVSDQWFIDHFRSRGSLGRGDYQGTIECWLASFAREQLELVFFEDILDRPRDVLMGLARHIGVEPSPFEKIPDAELSATARAGPGIPLRSSLLPVLSGLYAERIERLEALVERDLTAWKEDLRG